jgi:hypothetical protein
VVREIHCEFLLAAAITFMESIDNNIIIIIMNIVNDDDDVRVLIKICNSVFYNVRSIILIYNNNSCS